MQYENWLPGCDYKQGEIVRYRGHLWRHGPGESGGWEPGKHPIPWTRINDKDAPAD